MKPLDLYADKAPVEEPGATPEAPVAEAVEPHPDLDPEEAPAEEAAAEGDDEAAEPGDDLFPEHTSRKPKAEDRINQLVAQRNEARDRVVSLDKELANLNGQLEALKGLDPVFRKKYSKFEDPAGQLEYDAAVMDQLWELAQTDPHMKTVYDRLHAIVSHEAEGSTLKESPVSEPTPAPAADPRMEKLLAKEARGIVDGALPANLKPAFKKVFVNHLMSELSMDEVLDLDTEDVIGLAKAFAVDNEFTREDLYGPNVKPAASALPASEGKSPTEGKEKPAPEKVATAKDASEYRSQWNSRREEILGELFGE